VECAPRFYNTVDGSGCGKAHGPNPSRGAGHGLTLRPVRVAVVYDCLYPHTVGGAERWYRALSERLHDQHEVTYLTRRQWAPEEGPGTPFETVAVSPGGPLYTSSGRRRIWPPIRFGIGLFWHLLRHAGRYDIVHSASFPYFSLIAAWLALRIRRKRRLVVDWHEVWSRDYWLEYLGAAGGRIGYAVQRICVRLPERSFTFSRLHKRRLREEGHRAPLVRLTGEYSEDGGASTASSTAPDPPMVVFAGRHIREKRVTLVPDVLARCRARLPELRAVIYGDGPERSAVAERIEVLGLDQVIDLPGRVEGSRVREEIGRSSCLLLPSLREGYGLVVVEAIARGTPAVVVEGPDNAAAELVEHGVNGLVSTSAESDAIAQCVLEAIERGEQLRRSTIDWYRAHAGELSLERSLAAVERAYEARPEPEPASARS
jgi:glycosyltransferase involved in cell wall biosynthesis